MGIYGPLSQRASGATWVYMDHYLSELVERHEYLWTIISVS
jgi:hypothetical protein